MGNFNEVLLGDLCTFTQGVQIADKDTIKSHQEGYIRYIYIRDLFTDKYPVYVKDEHPKKVLNWGDIVMVNTGNTSGYVYRAKEGVLCNNAFKISVQEDKNDLLDKEFLWVYLNSSAREQMLKRLFNPAGQPHVGHKNVARLKLKLPPLPEQRKIAKILSTWDKAIRTTEKLIETSKQQKKALMQQLLTGKKRLVNPETGKAFEGEWEEVKLNQLTQITMGSSPKSDSYNESRNGLPLLQGNADIKARKSAPRIYTSQITKECSVGDILLSVRAPVGSVAKSLHNACIGRGIASIKSKNNVSQEFIYQWLLAFEPKWERFSQGSTFEAVNSNDIKTLHMTVPAFDEQLKVATVLTAADKEIELLEAKLAHFKQEKKALMQQLLTGKRRVKVDEEVVA